MKPIRWALAIVVTGAALFTATPRSEAGNFSFSILFPFPCEPRPPVCPPPPAPPPCKTWVPGHYETRTEKVWVPGACETVWVPPTYEFVWKDCHMVRVVCAPGHYEAIQHPGRYECREVRAWVPGHYEYANARDDGDDHPGRGHAYGRYKHDNDRDDSQHDKGSPSYF